MNEQKPTERQWRDIDRPTMPEPQEEFISEKARPSIDISELHCARCGKPAAEWEEQQGVTWQEYRFCSEHCKSVAQGGDSR